MEINDLIIKLLVKLLQKKIPSCTEGYQYIVLCVFRYENTHTNLGVDWTSTCHYRFEFLASVFASLCSLVYLTLYHYLKEIRRKTSFKDIQCSFPKTKKKKKSTSFVSA